MSRRSGILVINNFFPHAFSLRDAFESEFSVEKDIRPERFVWDYWYVKNQYKLLRTPAYEFFPKKIYQEFHSQLVQWGRENLGCHDISPPWLSYYIDGFSQELHADVPHGPWAFVYSLSPKQIKFRGGETLLLKDQVLDYWRSFGLERGHESVDFYEKISPKFNRLIVFDPRIPHGVTPVQGVEDPLEARVVIHGWFVEPRPYVRGSLSVGQVSQSLQRVLQAWPPSLGPWHGTLCIQIATAASGRVNQVHTLTNTLKNLEYPQESSRDLVKMILESINNHAFPRSKGSSKITVPFLFRD